ncbi:hypothetical protein GCM10010841_18310 [Deinococcus aerophilus]|uniref:Uncharacterized protein n=1 Tax=Deinococcus aerophilus TaxID=522488 RepID=A0ABQ2GSQ3_9DEIO|nr:hypothetical protein GCM10010841_18310 [Deinococcus aerophilus]
MGFMGVPLGEHPEELDAVGGLKRSGSPAYDLTRLPGAAAVPSCAIQALKYAGDACMILRFGGVAPVRKQST